jgi:predicted Ser/Thr protein kinase/tetratricopeptide (TPR) repeat protein
VARKKIEKKRQQFSFSCTCIKERGSQVIGASMHEREPELGMGDRPTSPDQLDSEATDEHLRADAPTLDGAPSQHPDMLFSSATPADNFEHRRVISLARHKLFGRGQVPRVGRYRVERRLGAGGMGEVYLGHDDELGRKVAIKRVRANLHSDRVQERLRREARALARLSHPNVVQVYEFGEHEGRTFVAMEFVDGQTLGDWLAEGGPTWRSVLDKFLAAGRGLAAVHEAGLVHRDFKPDNVLLSNDGRVLVADFGLVLAGEDRRLDAGDGAGQLSAEMRTSVTGAVLGTIRFMSLEQLQANQVDARSDQFAFCIALYEALWGKPPFSLVNSLTRLHDLETGVPMSPRSRDGLRPPAALWRVIRRGLSKNPGERWPDMPALLGALERVARQRRRLAWIGSVSAAVALAVGGLVLGQAEQPEDPCATVERELDGTWDAARRTEIATSLGGIEVGHAEESRERVFAGLDRWSAGWVHEREQICRAGVERRIEPELARLQGACLTRQLQRVEDLVTLLATSGIDGDTLAGAVEAVAELPAASACADELALLGVQPPAPTIEAEVEELRRELGRAGDLRRMGRLEEGLTLAEQTELAARELGYRPLMAEARAELAMAEIEGGSLQQGTERMQEAIDAAELAHHDHLAATLWLVLALSSLTELEQLELGSWQLRRASVANGRIEPNRRAEARLAFARGQLAELRGDEAEAERGYRDAIAAAEHDDGAQLDLPSYLSNLGRVVAKRDPTEANTTLRSALEVANRVYGPRHPETAHYLYAFAVALRTSDPGSSEVVELLERAVAIWVRSHRRPHRSLAHAEFLLGALALQHEDLDKALEHTLAAATIQASTLPEQHVDHGATAQLLAVIYSVRGEHEQALGQFERTLAVWEPIYGIGDPQVQRVHSDLAATRLALGRIDEAEKELTALLPHAAGPDEQISVRLQLCEAAVRRGRLDSAESELDKLDTLGLDDFAAHEFSYALLRALVGLRRGNLGSSQIERLRRARTTTRFTANQITSWLDQLELSAPERVALQIK